MRRWAPMLMILILPLSPVKAEALTTSDIIALSRAGLGDEVLLALIEMEGRVFTIDTAVLSRLKEAGVSETVIVAMIRSGRTPPDAVPPPPLATEVEPPEPQVIVIEHGHQAPVIQQVVVPVAIPVYVPVMQRVARPRTPSLGGAVVTPSGFGVPLPVRADLPPAKAVDPVYWGWGGKRRPDAWQEPKPESRRQKPD